MWWDFDDALGVAAKEIVGLVVVEDNDDVEVLGTGGFAALTLNAAADCACVGLTAKTPPLLHSPAASSKNLFRKNLEILNLKVMRNITIEDLCRSQSVEW